jgi:hypothetical protein
MDRLRFDFRVGLIGSSSWSRWASKTEMSHLHAHSKASPLRFSSFGDPDAEPDADPAGLLLISAGVASGRAAGGLPARQSTADGAATAICEPNWLFSQPVRLPCFVRVALLDSVQTPDCPPNKLTHKPTWRRSGARTLRSILGSGTSLCVRGCCKTIKGE